MTRFQNAARTSSLFLLTLALSTAASAQFTATPPPDTKVEYIPLTPQEFADKAKDLLNKDVEVGGDIVLPRMLGPQSVGTMVDPSGKVLVNLTAKPGSYPLEYLTGGDRATKTKGVFVRGKVVAGRGAAAPSLDAVDISKESKVQARAAMNERVANLTEKDKAGLVKEVLPPHTTPNSADAKAWLDRVPPTSPSFDRAKSVWDNMQARANWKMQADADDARAIIRGPDRPKNFETYYRGLRDTGLANIFADAPYKNSKTSWPRVMIVIEEKPRFNGGMPSEYFHSTTKTETDYTWRFHATLWTDATHKIDIAPFNWAFSEMRFNTPYSEVPIWGRTPKLNVPKPTEAEGYTPPAPPTPPAPGTPPAPPAPEPIAPRYPLPETPDYHRLFHYNTIMVGNLLLDMGFNYNRPDGRVWFVEDLAK
jgi:hypothetical protein